MTVAGHLFQPRMTGSIFRSPDSELSDDERQSLLACQLGSGNERGIMGMPSVRLIKHEAVPKCGSFEIHFPMAARHGSSTGTISQGGACDLIWSTARWPSAWPRYSLGLSNTR